MEPRLTHALIREGKVSRLCFSEKHAEAERLSEDDVVLPLVEIEPPKGKRRAPGWGEFRIEHGRLVHTPPFRPMPKAEPAPRAPRKKPVARPKAKATRKHKPKGRKARK